MGTYQIKDLEELSGIKAHTIRVWEQRYKIIQPKRTATNIRYYNDEDVRLLLNVAYLCKHRYRISKISQMSYEEMVDNIMAISKRGETIEHRVNEMTVAMLEFDVDKFEHLITDCINQMGFENGMLQIVIPFLKKIGVLWLTKAINPANEHYVSNIIRKKIVVATDSIAEDYHAESKKFLLFLPEHELHEITLLFANYLAKSRNHQTVYLGQNVPYTDLKTVVEKTNPDFLVTSMTTHPSADHALGYIQLLGSEFPDKKIFVSGQRVVSVYLPMPANVRRLDDFADLIEILEA
ncbi:MAG: MerR family transcriptional regulator [Verrucomicrobia bacterium]|nr:MerR family transcriptional regulator [Verrucomicrobiota bacterium]